MSNSNKMNVYKDINWKVMIPVMFFVMFQSASQAFSTVLADIAAVFPDASTTTIQMVMTIGTLVATPFSLFAGVLASYFYKKHLVLAALLVELVGGIIPLVSHNSIGSLVVASCLIGIGQGMLIPVASSVIGENFTGTSSGVAMGLKQAASSVGIAALTVATGYLARAGWYRSYSVYLLVIPVFIITALLLPKGQKDVRIIGSGGGAGLKKVLTRGVIYYSVLSFFISGFNFAFYTNIGMSIINRGLGDSASVGVASAWNSLITVIVGLIFGYILKAFKKYTLAGAMIIQAIAYFMMANVNSLSLIAIGGMIYGLGAGMQMIAACYYILESVDQNAASLATSICMAFTSIGISASPVIVNKIAGLFGELDGTTGLLASAVGLVVCFVIDVIYEAVFNKDSQMGK